jgi:hypothetical protein
LISALNGLVVYTLNQGAERMLILKTQHKQEIVVRDDGMGSGLPYYSSACISNDRVVPHNIVNSLPIAAFLYIQGSTRIGAKDANNIAQMKLQVGAHTVIITSNSFVLPLLPSTDPHFSPQVRFDDISILHTNVWGNPGSFTAVLNVYHTSKSDMDAVIRNQFKGEVYEAYRKVCEDINVDF